MCVHRQDRPTRCDGCRSLARAMGLLDRVPTIQLAGWYEEQLIDAWARAVGLEGQGQLWIGHMREDQRARDDRASLDLEAMFDWRGL